MSLSASSSNNLIGLAKELYCRGKQEDAISLFETALNMGRNPTKPTNAEAIAKQIQSARETLQDANEPDCPLVQHQQNLPDTYHEDECDVGPRSYRLPIFPDAQSFSETDPDMLEYGEILIQYNRGLLRHSQSDYTEGMSLYEAVEFMASRALQSHETCCCMYQKLLDLLMRVNNNKACIAYNLGLLETAQSNFEAALVFANRMLSLQDKHSDDIQLDFATLLSNWCRVQWMKGVVNEEVHHSLNDILRIRSSILGWNHMDTAAAHFNLGVAEYTRNYSAAAVEHLFSYLYVAAQETKGRNETKKQLDPIPALIYILLVKNEAKDDDLSQELARALRSLQEKRADVGPQGAEVASVLNYAGTLLFHQNDYEHALLFFQEELRLEENLVLNNDDVSISVTCNNIGRILQELNRLPEAKGYYYRALQAHYGDNIEEWCSQPKGSEFCPVDFSKKTTENLPHTTMQLYSAVWYNLGLIHDKLTAYGEATNAFQLSLELRRKMLGPNHGDCACLLYNIGVLQMEQQLLQDATASFREALRIRTVAPSAGHLNDSHVIQTLKKLSSLHKAKGNVAGALETLFEILNIQRNSTESQDHLSKQKEIGATLREIAELYHAEGRLALAVDMARESISLLKIARSSSVAGSTLFVACTEELVSALLLLGSLNHENCEPSEAFTLYHEASGIIQHVSTFFPTHTELNAMYEVTRILAACHCAPAA